MPRDKVDAAKRTIDAYNRRDVDGLFAELATPDLVWCPGMVRALDGEGYRGREGVERFAVDTRENCGSADFSVLRPCLSQGGPEE